MPDVNPYAAPQYDLPLHAVGDELRDGVWRDGELLVAHTAAVLPDRCIKCNAPHARPLKLKLHYAGPTRSFVFSNPLNARAARMSVPICDRHRRLRRKRIARTLCFRLVTLALSIPVLHYLFLQVGSATLGITVATIATLISVIFEAPHWAPPVEPHKIDSEFVWLSGVDPAYLAQFPAFPR